MNVKTEEPDSLNSYKPRPGTPGERTGARTATSACFAARLETSLVCVVWQVTA